jgi:EH_Signature domain
MRLAASSLFEGNERLADDYGLLEKYFDALRPVQSRMILKRLIHAYCIHFDPSHGGIERLGAFLAEQVSAVDDTWDWNERHRRYNIFTPGLAPQELAKATIESTDPRADLARAGLSGQLWGAGLSTYVFLSSLKTIQARLEKNPTLREVERAIAWVQKEAKGLYFSANRKDLVKALLWPWVDSDPPTEIRKRIQSFLLDVVSDPRIDRASWVGTDDTAREVMIRWLAQATLEQFLKVVDRVAAAHQWEYRRTFWNAYIEKGWVSNAWVAFASTGAAVAMQMAKESDDDLMRRFATLGGASADQAVLLLQIGDLFIADWSHNGKLRIWRRGNSHSPKFDEPSYIATGLRFGSDFDIAHLPPDGWQTRAESYIRRFTGLRLSSTEFMPPGRR